MAVPSNEVILRHPGSVVESFYYPSRADSVVTLASATNVPGRLRVTSNSLSLSATSNFNIGLSDIIHGLCVVGTLTVPASNVISAAGWMFSLINRLEVVFPNSSSPSIVIDGDSLSQYMLLTCKDQQQRDRLLELAGMPAAAGASSTGSIPLWWILGSAVGLGTNYPLDMGALGGPLQINITWNPSTYIICRTGAAPATTLTAFDSLYLTASVSELDNPQLSVRNLLQDPTVAYPLHGKGLISVTYPMTFALGVQQSINLQSCPDAGLDAIILTIRPSAELSANADGTSNYFGSVPITQVQLTQGGKILFQANNRSEYRAHLRNTFGGDDLYYRYAWDSANSSAAAAQDLIETQVIVIPFNLYSKQVLSGKLTENMKSYSNSPLQLTFTPTTRSVYDASASPFYATASNPRGGAGSQAYLVNICYVTASMLDIDRNGVKVVY